MFRFPENWACEWGETRSRGVFQKMAYTPEQGIAPIVLEFWLCTPDLTYNDIKQNRARNSAWVSMTSRTLWDGMTDATILTTINGAPHVGTSPNTIRQATEQEIILYRMNEIQNTQLPTPKEPADTNALFFAFNVTPI